MRDVIDLDRPFFTSGNPYGPSPHRGLRRSDVSESDRLNSRGVQLCAWEVRNPGTATMN